MNEKYNRYVEIQLSIKALQEEADAIKVELVADMEASKVREVEHAFGKFYFTTRKTWTYPEEYSQNVIKPLKDALKDVEERAQKDGTATCTESKSLAFRGNL